jgi:hypothetical protein
MAPPPFCQLGYGQLSFSGFTVEAILFHYRAAAERNPRYVKRPRRTCARHGFPPQRALSQAEPGSSSPGMLTASVHGQPESPLNQL